MFDKTTILLYRKCVNRKSERSVGAVRKSALGVTVKSASQQLGIPEPAVRVLMRRRKLPIGIAEKIGGERYTYYISQELIDSYLMRRTEDKEDA